MAPGAQEGELAYEDLSESMAQLPDALCDAAAGGRMYHLRRLLAAHRGAAALAVCSEKYSGPPLACAVLSGHVPAGEG